jgi:hypothetical protein
LTTVYTAYNGVFRTPIILPAQQFIRLRLTTAITSGRAVYLDKLAMGTMTQMYTQGPFLALFAGSNPFVQGDYTNISFTNSRGAGGVLDTWQTLFARLFYSQVFSNEFILPSSPTPTIADTLIG